jgi:hypothetical protein
MRRLASATDVVRATNDYATSIHFRTLARPERNSNSESNISLPVSTATFNGCCSLDGVIKEIASFCNIPPHNAGDLLIRLLL